MGLIKKSRDGTVMHKRTVMSRYTCDIVLSTWGPVLHAFCDNMHCKFTQRENIKFSIKMGNSVTETLEMVQQAYGNEAMSQARCFEWHSRFKRGISQDDLTILTHNVLSFLHIFKGSAHEAFHGSLLSEFNTEFVV